MSQQDIFIVSDDADYKNIAIEPNELNNVKEMKSTIPFCKSNTPYRVQGITKSRYIRINEIVIKKTQNK